MPSALLHTQKPENMNPRSNRRRQRRLQRVVVPRSRCSPTSGCRRSPGTAAGSRSAAPSPPERRARGAGRILVLGQERRAERNRVDLHLPQQVRGLGADVRDVEDDFAHQLVLDADVPLV